MIAMGCIAKAFQIRGTTKSEGMEVGDQYFNVDLLCILTPRLFHQAEPRSCIRRIRMTNTLVLFIRDINK